MINYRKGKNVEEELTKEHIPISNLPEDFLWMHVKGGTKVSNVVDFAKGAFAANKNRTVVWTGSGGGVVKTISCAEIMKRDMPALHQVTRINYRNVEEYWDPQVDGLEQLVTTRQIPCVHILLSLDEISESVSGHQLSTVKTKFWVEQPIPESRPKSTKNHQQGNNNKRGSNTSQHTNRPSTSSGAKKQSNAATSKKTTRKDET